MTLMLGRRLTQVVIAMQGSARVAWHLHTAICQQARALVQDLSCYHRLLQSTMPRNSLAHTVLGRCHHSLLHRSTATNTNIRVVELQVPSHQGWIKQDILAGLAGSRLLQRRHSKGRLHFIRMGAAWRRPTRDPSTRIPLEPHSSIHPLHMQIQHQMCKSPLQAQLDTLTLTWEECRRTCMLKIGNRHPYAACIRR